MTSILLWSRRQLVSPRTPTWMGFFTHPPTSPSLRWGCLSHYDAQTLVTHPASELGSYRVHSTLQPSSLAKTQYIFPTEIDEYLIRSYVMVCLSPVSLIQCIYMGPMSVYSYIYSHNLPNQVICHGLSHTVLYPIFTAYTWVPCLYIAILVFKH